MPRSQRAFYFALAAFGVVLYLMAHQAAQAGPRTYQIGCWYRWQTDDLLFCEREPTIFLDDEVRPKQTIDWLYPRGA